MRDVERLAMLGQLSGFIGHELRNPLAVMETSLHLLQRRLPIGDDKAAHHMTRLREQVSLAGGIISDLVELARDRPLVRRPVEDLKAQCEAALHEVPGPTDAVVAIALPEDLPAPRVDEKQLRRLLVNLLSNALQAVQGRPDPRIRVAAAIDHDSLLLIVEDNGPGIAEEVRYRLFEPLTTTRPKGLGLGLALCRRIAERHGGDIRALASPDLGGARLEVRLAQAFGQQAGEP
jgi:C4-dicarboxylate-specific signal transduction histidine kinase